MTDLILQTDPLEFQNSRQSTKIIFLQQELQQAQEYARDLEQIVKINKEALRIATQPIKPAATKSKSPAVNESTSTFDTNTSSRDEVKRLQSLVEKLTEENSKFLEIVDKAKKERNTAQSKALISEQICEEAQRHESETVHELEEKITDLRKLLQDKEYAIQELEKLKPIPEQEGVVIKYREVLNPTEQNMRFHNEIDSLNGMLAKVSKELNKVQLEKQELQHLNYSLTTELAKVKATFSSPLTHQKNFGRLNSGSEIPPGFQGAYFQPPIEFLDENSPLPSPLPSHGGEAFNQHASKAPVPKLDLSKAKQIQEQYAKKITQPQQQNYNQTYTVPAMDKVKQLEDELELTRKRFSHEMINNRLLGEELARMKKQLTQVISTNDILIKSNKRYEEKWQKIFYTLEFYKDFYHKYIDLITRGPGGHMKSASVSASTPKFDSVPKFNGKFFTNLDSDPEKMIKDLRRNNEDHGKHVNVSILEANEEESEHEPGSTNEEGKLNNVIEFNKEQSKIYLLNLAKDLYVNSNLQKSNIAKRMLQNLKIGTNGAVPKPIFKLKRSLSNPLEYVSERKQLIIEPKGGNPNKLKKPRHEEEDLEGQEEDFENNDGEDTPASGGNVLNVDPNSVKLPKQKFDMHDEMISFTVDPDDFNKNRMVEASFISNTDILENLRNN